MNTALKLKPEQQMSIMDRMDLIGKKIDETLRLAPELPSTVPCFYCGLPSYKNDECSSCYYGEDFRDSEAVVDFEEVDRE